MKTSKIIFFSLLGSVAFIILAGLVSARLVSTKTEPGVMSKISIPSFKVLYIKNCDVHLSYGDSSFIGVEGKKDFQLSEINYKVSNDTLKISDIRYSHDSYTMVNIYSTDSLNNIEVVNSDLTIDKFGSKNLQLGSDNSFIRFNHEFNKEFAFQSLTIMAKKHSSIDTDDFTTDNLSIFLEKSDAYLQITAQKVSGTLSDSSSISMKQAGDISLKKDGSSRISVN